MAADLTVHADRDGAAHELVSFDESDLEHLVMTGDISKLPPLQRIEYYKKYCSAFGMNWLTQPIMYYRQQGGGLAPYVKRAGAEQLRDTKKVRIRIVDQRVESGLYLVTCEATLPDGRSDQDVGAVPLPPSGADRANAIKKAITQAKRRVTLSICGLGIPDESEVSDIPGAERVAFAEVITPRHDAPPAEHHEIHDPETGEVEQPAAKPPKTIPLYDESGAVAGNYPNATDWLAGLEMSARSLPGIINANWEMLTRIATSAKTPADVRERAERLRETAERLAQQREHEDAA